MLASAFVLASCGGSDDDAAPAAEDTASSESDVDASEAADAETTGDESAPEENSSASDDSSAGSVAPEASSSEPADDDSSGGGSCDEIFSAAEIEELFAEPAQLSEETNEDLGSLMCTWETIEDENDMEDLAFKILVTQFFTGDPIPASSFIDPSIFDTVTTVEGVGDLAFSTGGLGTDYYFLDEPVAGSLSYTEKDLGSDAPPLRTTEDIEALLRTFHDRVT